MDYKKLYEIIGEYTPIEADCGVLCKKACCSGDTDTGMYLYPDENLDSENIYKSDFVYASGKEVQIYICDGTCDREFRPLACRIFPFVPYINYEGEVEVIVDPRAETICPLASCADEVDFDDEFLDRVSEAITLGMECDDFMSFIEAQSKLIDEYEVFL